jgi:hypothetical protein
MILLIPPIATTEVESGRVRHRTSLVPIARFDATFPS